MDKKNRNRLKLISLLMLCFVFLSTFAFAQKTITGKVTDANDNSPIVGVTVVVKGSTVGTVTNVDGEYQIASKTAGDILVFSYIGYTAQEVPVNNQSIINVSLKVNTMDLSEVVIVGYGTQKKEDLTGAISMVTSEDLEKSNATDISRALQGRASGVSIMSTSGRPGSTMNIRVRGVGSIMNNAQPMVIIDGVNSSTDALNNLSPQDIESVSVLKDAASAAIYGAQSANGVILVKTKRGVAGKPRLKLSVQTGMSQLPKRMDIMNAEEYLDYYSQVYAVHNARFPNSPAIFPSAYSDSTRASLGWPDTDWQDLITNRQAISQNYYLAISGGNEGSTYLISGNYINEKGVLKTTYRNLVSFRVNTNTKINDYINIGENMAFNTSDSRIEGASGAWLDAAIASPLMPVYNPLVEKGYAGPTNETTYPNDVTNPYAELMLNENTNTGFGIIGDVYLEITPFKGLKFRSDLAANYSSNNNSVWNPKYDLGVRSNTTANLNESISMWRHLQFENTLTYENSIKNHNFVLLAGHSVIDQFSNTLNGSGSDYTWESLRVVQGGDPLLNSSTQYKTPNRLQSFFFRGTYDYLGKYLLQVVVRRDGSSKFGPLYRYGNFPSASVGWKLNEDLLQDVEQIDMLKLRLGYGRTGNVPDANFLYDSRISIYDEHVYTMGTDNHAVFGAAPFYNFGSPTIHWETAIMSNIGVDLNAFNNKLQFSGEYYIKKYDGLLSNLPLQAIYGLSGDATPPIVNLGDLDNHGFEFNATYQNSEGKLKYSISGNLTTVKNKVDYLPTDEIFSTNGFAIAKIGHAVGSYYGYVAERILTEDDFEHDDNGNILIDTKGAYTPIVPRQQALTAPGDIKFKDLNKDGVINETDQTIIGKTIPDFTYGLNIDLNYGNFDLSVFFQGVQNVDMFNQYYSRAGLGTGDATSHDHNKLKETANFWTQDNQAPGRTGVALTDFNNNGRLSTWWIEDASFLRVKTVQLGYSIPKSVIGNIGLSETRIYIGSENLLTFTKYSGYDPEISSTNPLSGIADGGSYPVPRTFTFGININF